MARALRWRSIAAERVFDQRVHVQLAGLHRVEDAVAIDLRVETVEPLENFFDRRRRISALGKPLPAGLVRVYAADSRGKSQFLGEDRINHTAKGQPVTGAPQFDAGRLGKLEIKGDNVILGTPFTFTKANVRGFDF